jgi:AraC-like DNA-binding protein
MKADAQDHPASRDAGERRSSVSGWHITTTRSVAEAAADLTMFRCKTIFKPLGMPDAFRLDIDWAAIDDLKISVVRSTGHLIGLVEEEALTLLAPARGMLSFARGDLVTQVDTTALAFPALGLRETAVAHGAVVHVIQFPLARLVQSAAQHPSDGWDPARGWPARVDLRRGPPSSLHRYMHLLIEEIEAGALSRSPRTRITAAMLLTDLLIDVLSMPFDQVQRTPRAGTAALRLAEEFIRANLAEPLTVRAVAARAGVGTRALELAFRSRHGCTPRDFIQGLRLEAAQRRLVAAQATETVTTIALECGIAHLGRFSEHYRHRFGETPSSTLARARRR